MKRLAFLFSLLLLLFAGCRPHYVILDGFDFATGELVVAKFWQDKETGKLDDKPVWIKRSPRYSEYYRKYKLSYPEPILIYVACTYYAANGVGCRDGYSPYFEFFNIISKYSPPKEAVQEMFKHCIELYELKADNKTVKAYLDERGEYFKAKSAAVK